MQSSRPTHEETFEAINDNLKEFERRLAKRKKINKKDYQKEIEKLAALLSLYSREVFLGYDNILNINEVNSPLSHQHVVNFGTQITRMVAEDILTRDSIQGSALAFNRWSMVLEALHNNFDFNAAQAVSTGLDNAVVTTLAKEFPANEEAKNRMQRWADENITWSGRGYNTQMKYIAAGRVMVPYLGDFKGKTVTFAERSADFPTAKFVLKLAEVDDVLIEAQELLEVSKEKNKERVEKKGEDEKVEYEGNLLALFSHSTLQNYEQIFANINSIIDFIEDGEKQEEIRKQINGLYDLISKDKEQFDNFVGNASDLNKFREPLRDQQRKNRELQSPSVAQSDFYASLIVPTDVDFSKIEKEKVLPLRMATLSRKLEENKVNFRKAKEKYKRHRSKNEVPTYKEGQSITPEMIIERRYYYAKKISNLLDELPALTELQSKRSIEKYLATVAQILAVRDEWGDNKDPVIMHHLSKKKEAENSMSGFRSNISLAGDMYSLFDLLETTKSLVNQKLNEFDKVEKKKVKAKSKKGKEKRKVKTEKGQTITSSSGVTMKKVPTHLVSKAFKSQRDLKRAPHTPIEDDKPASDRAQQMKRAESPRTSNPSPRSPRIEAAKRQFDAFQSTGVLPSANHIKREMEKEAKAASESQVRISPRRNAITPHSPVSRRGSVRLQPHDIEQAKLDFNDNQSLVSPRRRANSAVTPRTPKGERDSTIQDQPAKRKKSKAGEIHSARRAEEPKRSKSSPSYLTSDLRQKESLSSDSLREKKADKPSREEKKKRHQGSYIYARHNDTPILDDERPKSGRGRSRTATQEDAPESLSFLRHTTVVRTASGRKIDEEKVKNSGKEKELQEPKRKKQSSFISGGGFISVFGGMRKRKEEEEKNPEIEKKPPTPRSPRGGKEK